MAFAGAILGDDVLSPSGSVSVSQSECGRLMRVSDERPLFTVIICTHSMQRHGDLVDSINSVLGQVYDNVEIIVVVDRCPELYNSIKGRFSKDSSIIVLMNRVFPGLSGSRNLGIRQSNGEFIAFLDDDAVADRYWLTRLSETYDGEDVIGCGGPILPLWVAGEAKYIPEEFYWVMGCTYKGFKNEIRTIRSNFGSNMSFRKEAFEIDAFDVRLGIRDGKGAGEELEFSLRLLRRNPSSVILHNPESIVYHKIFQYRKSIKHLFKRCIEYGMGVGQHRKELGGLPPQVERDDERMVDYLLFESIPERLSNIFRKEGRSGKELSTEIIQLSLMGLSSILIISGIIYGQLRKRGS